MENSLLTVYLNVHPIHLQNNLSFDQTNKDFHLLLIFKNELLNLVLSFIKELYMFKYFREKLHAVFIFNILQKSRYLYFLFYKSCLYIFYILQAF